MQSAVKWQKKTRERRWGCENVKGSLPVKTHGRELNNHFTLILRNFFYISTQILCATIFSGKSWRQLPSITKEMATDSKNMQFCARLNWKGLGLLTARLKDSCGILLTKKVKLQNGTSWSWLANNKTTLLCMEERSGKSTAAVSVCTQKAVVGKVKLHWCLSWVMEKEDSCQCFYFKILYSFLPCSIDTYYFCDKKILAKIRGSTGNSK